jgi:ATP-binding protein involved in chromosome partitioning
MRGDDDAGIDPYKSIKDANIFYKNRGYFMSITENNRNRASKKNTDEVAQVQDLHKSMSSIKHKFLVMSSQGGVGKASVIVNLAVALSKKGVKVGLLDANYHGPDICRMLGLEPGVASVSDKPFIPVAYSDDLKVVSVESVMQVSDGTGGWAKPLKESDIRRFISRVNWGSLDYLFVDTPPGPGEGLLTVIRAHPEAKTIIVTAPNILGRDRAKNMINFFRKEKIPIFGWIENMRGFFCQDCGKRQELFSSGSGSRAVFLGDIPFLGRIPIDPHVADCADAGEPFLEKYPESEIAEACNLIIDKIWGGNRANLSEDRSVYYDL